MTTLDVRDLDVSYGSVRALKAVSLTVDSGEVVALLGANGAGKSTLLRAISGLTAASAGNVLLDGRDVLGMPAHKVVELGCSHVPEGRRLFSTLTVDENLTLGGYLLRRDKAALESRRERVYQTFPVLRDRSKQLAGTMSGGEQQMVAIGRALMCAPKLLVLDEPSLGLAPRVTQSVLEVVAQIAASGIAVLLVEQNARQALAVSCRGYVLEAGCIVLADAADALAADERIQKAYLGGFGALA